MNHKTANPGAPPPALECGDSSPLCPLGGLVHQAAPRLAAWRAEAASPPADGDKSPAESDDKSSHSKIPWPHAPIHKLTDNAVYFVTAGTLHKERLFDGKARLDLLERKLMELAKHYHWRLEAWAVFANHYHVVARGFPDSVNLGKFLKHLHSDTARELNRLDGKEGRKVWFNFRDTKWVGAHDSGETVSRSSCSRRSARRCLADKSVKRTKRRQVAALQSA